MKKVLAIFSMIAVLFCVTAPAMAEDIKVSSSVQVNVFETYEAPGTQPVKGWEEGRSARDYVTFYGDGTELAFTADGHKPVIPVGTKKLKVQLKPGYKFITYNSEVMQMYIL